MSDPTADERLHRWIAALVRTPGLTAVTDPAEAWQLHIDDALSALPFLGSDGPIVDVGSGGGSPGIPLAAACPDLTVVLLEASRRRCAFLETVAKEFPNVQVVCARAEEHGRAAGRDAYAVALARALAPATTALEWALPLVRPGGQAILYLGLSPQGLARSAAALEAGAPRFERATGRYRQLAIFPKLGPTPPRFPRRAGIARKRPLA